ncbi:MAG: ABC transporter permease [Methanomassiliicoccales archaeon]|nr:ABC transporter permease [Methanomassiliicoccales archaeon]
MATTTEPHTAAMPAESSSTISFDDITAQLRPRIREWKNSWDLIRHNWTAMLGFILIVAIIIIALLAPLLAPPSGVDPLYIPRDFDLPKPPFIEGHPLGTGQMGADIYYGVIWGARTTIITSLYVVLTAALVGLVVGAISGYYGGVIDEILMRFTDIFLSLPALIMAMAIASILTRSLENMMFALILVWWPSYARLIRGQVLTIRESTYVEAAKAIGAKRGRILFRHIVPNSLSPLIVSITLDLGAVALTAASLSYIGFGVPSGYAEWGRMVSDGQGWFLSTVPFEGVNYTPWWVVTFPALMILLFTMGFSLLGDGLRDILDPRSRR